jgi:hypothetical protein
MQSIYQYYEKESSPFAESRNMVLESGMTISQIKKWISDNYQYSIDSKNSRKYAKLPTSCIKVDENSGEVIISDLPGRKNIHLNENSDSFTNGFKIMKIEGNLWIDGNVNKNIKGYIEEVTGAVRYFGCKKMTDLKNSPKKINDDLIVVGMEKLKSINCSTDLIQGNVEIRECHKLETLNGFPKQVNGKISIKDCNFLTSYGDAINFKERIKFFDFANREIGSPIDKYAQDIQIAANKTPGRQSILDLTPELEVDGRELGTRSVVHDVMKLMMEVFDINLSPDDIRVINSDDIPEIEIHKEGIADVLATQNTRRTLRLSKKTKLEKLVGKLKIVNYTDNFDLDGAAPDLSNFNDIFINAKPWRLRAWENNYLKDLSCLSHITNVPFRRIVVGDCPKFTALKVCPDEVSLHLYIENCPKFKGFECQLPDKIHWIKVIHCPKLTSLEGISKEIRGLECYATGIKSFEGGIESVYQIDAHNCKDLATFKGLPEQVEYLIVSKCPKLSSLDYIPKLISNLSIKGTSLGPFKTKRDLLPHCTVNKLTK